MADISKITLPSGNTYEIKDAVAREMISGGVSFVIAWDGTGTADATKVPKGVKAGSVTGTLEADDAEPGAFYLVKSASTPSSETLDKYDEYVPVGTSGSKTWEKIGDTQLNLSDVVTDVSLSKQTDTVIGTDATFTVTQPTISLATATSGGVEVANGGKVAYMKATASGAAVTPSTTNIKATASGGGTSWNAKDAVTAVTGYPNTTSDTFVKSVTAETGKNLVTTSIVPTNGTETVSQITATTNGKLVTTTVPNVTGNTDVSIPNVTGNTSVTASKITSNDSITANKSTWTFTMGSGADSETLIIGGGNGSDVTATNTAYDSVTASNTTLGTALSASKVTLGTAKTVATGSVSGSGTGSSVMTGITASDKTVAKVGTAVTVATGETDASGEGDAVVTGVTVGTSAAALTGLGTPSTKSAIGANSTFTNTQPTVALATGATTGTGVISVATGISSVTQPSITLTSDSTDAADRVEFIQSIDTTNVKATASGGNVAWNNKDSVTVLKNTTDVSVTKGNA